MHLAMFNRESRYHSNFKFELLFNNSVVLKMSDCYVAGCHDNRMIVCNHSGAMRTKLVTRKRCCRYRRITRHFEGK